MSLLTGLITYYKLDEESGNAIDSIGGRNGTIEGATQNVNGIINKCCQFNGSSNYIHAQNPVGGTINEISIGVWFKISDLSVTRNILFQVTGTGLYPRIHVSSNGQLGTQYRIDGSTKSISSEIGKIEINKWYNVILTISKNTGGKLYINGIYNNQNTATGSYIDGGTNELIIGRDTNLGAWGEGLIDEIYIYNRILTPQEIVNLFRNGNGNQYPFSENDDKMFNVI